MDISGLKDHNDLCVGIDLGTTNSVLATINEKPNGEVVSKVVEISRGVDMYNAVSGEAKLTTMKKPTLPSCVYYRQEKNYEPLVGDFAKMQYPLRPHLVAKSIKSQMGQPLAEGLLLDIPDKTPAQISSRILKHLLREASKVYRCDIKDAVITVPANFDSAMCKATRDAAELAGIMVKNSDGSERPVLLSEPNAVIYDLINQIHNGEISGRILDLSEKKRVLVFDLGGGTLDITMHEIKRRMDDLDVLKVDEIATNRYTLLGGDDFDEEIAKAMYKRYLKQYASHQEVVAKLCKEEKVIIPQLRVYAENLKLDLNERCGGGYDSGWDEPEDGIELPTGGNMGGIGYSYDDNFTQEEIEKILSIFMAEELNYADYKRLDKISNTRNIIYPILDVLKKASEKLGTTDVIVDAVIVNGGMSKFYMVTDRLKKFFGFEPIVALDPDQAVARGAAVYHYYLHKHDEIRDDMKLLGKFADNEEAAYGNIESKKRPVEVITERKPTPQVAIQWGHNILNDCLYLGVKNGAVHEIIPTGAELPYDSDVMTGFRIEPQQSVIAIPIKSRNLDGTYRTIANGNISFKKTYKNGAYVAFAIHMASNKVITMEAWTSENVNGMGKIEVGSAEIAIDNGERSKAKAKIIAPSGSKLSPREEINNLLQLCQNFDKNKNKSANVTYSKRIASCVTDICNAGNKEDFSRPVLEALKATKLFEARTRLFTIARKIGTTWSETDGQRLADACLSQLNADIYGFESRGPKVSTNIQAIYTMSMCANPEQLDKLRVLRNNPKYLHACMYTHAKTRTAIHWLRDKFDDDAGKVLKGHGSNIQFSSYAIGVALRKDGLEKSLLSTADEGKIVKRLCEIVKSGKLSSEELTCCILALGWIADKRTNAFTLGEGIVKEVRETLGGIEGYYSDFIALKQEKACQVAIKMVNGYLLDVSEEQFLLTKLEIL